MSRKTLEETLNENVPVIEGKKLYIWGMGNTALLYDEGIQRLEKEGFFHISGYCDNNIRKTEKKFFCKKPVVTLEELCKTEEICVLICSPQFKVYREVRKQLNCMGVENYLIDEVILKHHAKEVLQVYDSLGDLRSRETYEELIECRMCNRLPAEKMYSGSTYFSLSAFKRRNTKEVFVDCGGYVGDTIEQYLWRKTGSFDKIIAFEPDKNNYDAMVCRVERLKKEWNINDEDIQLYPYGVGKDDVELEVQKYDRNHGLGSKISVKGGGDMRDTEPCSIVSLDCFLKEPYHFLKADIEGYEYGMLLGAEKGIKANRPMIAVCIYHNAVDFYSIPLLIQRFVPEYHFAVRHHSSELDETVFYAWMEE